MFLSHEFEDKVGSTSAKKGARKPSIIYLL
jgi:hypothetical protein